MATWWMFCKLWDANGVYYWKKFQNSDGSVDEKLATCDFKRREYLKLFSQLGYRVEYIFVFSDWFMDRKYKDVLEYIKNVGCHYYFCLLYTSDAADD